MDNETIPPRGPSGGPADPSPGPPEPPQGVPERPDGTVPARSGASSAPAAIVLAAGQGVRMRSALPKVLHEIMGRPMLAHVLNAVRYLEPDPLVVVTGHGAEAVEAAAAPFGALFARQAERLGTGHAVSMAEPILRGRRGTVVIVPGDVPLISPQTLIDFLDAHRALAADLSVLSARVEWPGAYGRIIRDRGGWLQRVVEARDATEAELAINEVNSGVYAADLPKLLDALSRLTPDNDQKEYYLTDAVEIFRRSGWSAAAVEGPDPMELQGVNDRRELALLQSISRERINLSWLLAGVTMADPSTAHVEPSVKLARDVRLGQGVVLTGATTVGPGAVVGPYCCLHDVDVGAGAELGPHLALRSAVVPPGAAIRPPAPELPVPDFAASDIAAPDLPAGERPSPDPAAGPPDQAAAVGGSDSSAEGEDGGGSDPGGGSGVGGGG